MKNKLKELLKKIPLKTRIKVAVESYFINKYGGSFFIPIDENGEEDKDTKRRNEEIFKEIKPLIDLLMKEIDQWNKDNNKKI